MYIYGPGEEEFYGKERIGQMGNSDDLIRQAREMLECVTDGPWGVPHTSKSGTRVFGPDLIHTSANGDDVPVRRMVATCEMGSQHERKANALFIAWCREGVPALIAELEKRNG